MADDGTIKFYSSGTDASPVVLSANFVSLGARGVVLTDENNIAYTKDNQLPWNGVVNWIPNTVNGNGFIPHGLGKVPTMVTVQLLVKGTGATLPASAIIRPVPLGADNFQGFVTLGNGSPCLGGATQTAYVVAYP